MKSKIFKLIGVIVLIEISYVTYMWFMPHQNVQGTKAFKTTDATALVNEFLADKDAANEIYLDNEGESKVLIITCTIADISKDQLNQKVVLLKNTSEKMGVACTFTVETNSQVDKLAVGNTVKIKGMIRSGAEYDEDLDLTENIIVEKSAVIE